MGCFCSKPKKGNQTDNKNSAEKKEETFNILPISNYSYYTPQEMEDLEKIHKVKQYLNYENLVIAGGGIKCEAECGALKALDEMGILKRIQRFAGSSGGAIVAAFAALGFTPAELIQIMLNTDFSKFIRKTTVIGVLEDCKELIDNLGCNNGDSFEKFIEGWIETKTGNKNYTFKDLYQNQKKILVITGTDINSEQTVYFSHISHPNMPIKKAIRISMSIPILFEPVGYEGDLFVDGGMFDNYPIHVFDGKFPGDPQAVNNLIPINPKTIGFKLMRKKDRANLDITAKESVQGLKSYSMKLINALYDSNERHFMRPSYWERSILLPVPDLPLDTFHVSNDINAKMVSDANEACYKYFK